MASKLAGGSAVVYVVPHPFNRRMTSIRSARAKTAYVDPRTDRPLAVMSLHDYSSYGD